MIDALSLEIEKSALRCNGSYIEAVIGYCEKNDIYDYEDVIESLDPILVDKIRAEFINKKYIPSLMKKNTIEEFFG